MSTVSLQQAQAKLPALIHQLKSGEEVVITENNQPIARLLPAISVPHRKLGSLRGTMTSYGSGL